MKKHLILSLFVLIGFGLQAQWKTLSTEGSATKRHETGFVAHKGELYLIGGRGVKPVEKYDLETNTWTAMGETPIEMHHMTPVSVGDKIYVVGGLTGSFPEEPPLTHVYAYDPAADEWSQALEIPEDRRRGGAGVTVYEGRIYIVNGITLGHTSGTSAMFDVYDPEANTWTTLSDAPSIRDHSAAVIFEDKLIALGGRNTSYHEDDDFFAFFGKVNATVDQYDFKTKTWTTFENEMPAPAAGGGAVVLDGQVYYMGGETNEELAYKQVYAFDPDAGTWTEKPFLNQGRHGTNAAVIDGTIYIAAGCANRGGSPELNSVEVLSDTK